MYKYNENIGIGTRYRQVPKIKVSYRATTGKSGIGASLVCMFVFSVCLSVCLYLLSLYLCIVYLSVCVIRLSLCVSVFVLPASLFLFCLCCLSICLSVYQTNFNLNKWYLIVKC